ncbi:MAG TPA: ATP-binding cassette domain-containing protein [Candidatus Binatia bacterium]|nr:ATP-binding cassette domain-containing protein [Candidatus Binatia bacterium]
MIKVDNLSKQFRKKVAVDNISFQVVSGKVTGFLGPNGAGKSTTMRLMLGLDNGGGKTTFDSKKLYEYAQPAKIVGILLEAKAFHPTRSPRNHLKILAAAGQIPMARVDEVLDIVGLKSEAKGKPGKFSLGMSQRLGIAAALLGNPKYLFLDEPGNGLDPEGIAWLRQFLKSYADEGNGVFISSHLLSEISQIADDVVVIGRGKLIANTSMKELVTGNAHSSVFVRTNDSAKLKKLLEDDKLSYTASDGGLEVSGVKTDKIGLLAAKANIPILELTTRSASLEDVFLEITEGTEEFQAHEPKGKK